MPAGLNHKLRLVLGHLVHEFELAASKAGPVAEPCSDPQRVGRDLGDLQQVGAPAGVVAGLATKAKLPPAAGQCPRFIAFGPSPLLAPLPIMAAAEPALPVRLMVGRDTAIMGLATRWGVPNGSLLIMGVGRGEAAGLRRPRQAAVATVPAGARATTTASNAPARCMGSARPAPDAAPPAKRRARPVPPGCPVACAPRVAAGAAWALGAAG